MHVYDLFCFVLFALFLFFAFFHLFCTGTTCVLFSVLQRGERDDLQIQIQICLSVCRPGWLRCDCRWLRSRYQLFSVLSSLGSLEAKTISFHFHIKDTKRGEQQEFRKEAKKKRNDRHDKCHRKTSSESTREARERKREYRGDRASERGREGERSKQ